MAKGNGVCCYLEEIIAINLDTSSNNSISDSASTFQISNSEEIDYSSLERSKSGGNESNAKSSFLDISKAKACILAKAQASDASSKAIVQASGSQAKVQVSGSKAKIQASMAKASGLKAQASPKTLIVKSHVPITNCVIGLANAQTWDAILSKTFEVKIPPTITCAKKKKMKRKNVEIINLSSNSSDYSKGVPKEGPSVASHSKGVPKEGPSVASVRDEGSSIQGLLDLYRYNTVEEYLSDTYFPSTDKDSTDEDTIYEANSPMSKEDEILKKIGVRKPGKGEKKDFI
nr:hypothetical protein [Tanacetum cinerariifolium]